MASRPGTLRMIEGGVTSILQVDYQFGKSRSKENYFGKYSTLHTFIFHRRYQNPGITMYSFCSQELVLLYGYNSTRALAAERARFSCNDRAL